MSDGPPSGELSASAYHPSSERASASGPTGGATILLIDDDRVNLATTAHMLHRLGHRAIPCGDCAEAVRVCNERREAIDLVILDMVMPMMGGRETFEAMRAIHPGLRVLLMSGCCAEGEADDLIRQGARGFLQKPYRLAEIDRAVIMALEIPPSIAAPVAP